METRIDFVRWLSKKLHLTSFGFYVTVGLIMILPTVFVKFFGLSQFWASFSVFFIVVFLRAAYESLVIYEAPVKSLSLPKMLFLVFITSSVLSLVSCWLKPTLGYFSIPVSLVISLTVVTRLKAILWPANERPGFFAELPAKLDVNKLSTYGFYGVFVGITYVAYAKLGLNFYCAFAGGFFVGVIFEEIYNVLKVYEQELDTQKIIVLGAWAAFCALLSTVIIFVLMQSFGYSGQVATITSVIALKLVQPLGLRKFVLGL